MWPSACGIGWVGLTKHNVCVEHCGILPSAWGIGWARLAKYIKRVAHLGGCARGG